MSKLWKIFHTKQDSNKTSTKDGHHRDAIPSGNEGKNMLELSTSHYCSTKLRAHTNRNQITMDIRPTDDPT